MHAHALNAAGCVRARATDVTALMRLRVRPLCLPHPLLMPVNPKMPGYVRVGIGNSRAHISCDE